MAKPASFEIVKTSNFKKALEMVSFPIERAATFYRLKDKFHSIERGEALIRTDQNKLIGTVSSGYKIISHEESLSSGIRGLQNSGIPFSLKSIGLDAGGARMMARFQLDKVYPIIKGVDLPGGMDVLHPELTLINSYDGSLSLGFDLGSFRLVCLNLATSAISDVKARWIHCKTAQPEHLEIAAREALDAFEKHTVPMYRKMAENELSDVLGRKAIALAAKKDILPKKLVHFAEHCVVKSEAALEKEKNLKRSAWTLFNAFTWTTTHKFTGSPSRSRDLQQSVARIFKDGGVNFLKEAGKLSAKEVDEILQAA